MRLKNTSWLLVYLESFLLANVVCGAIRGIDYKWNASLDTTSTGLASSFETSSKKIRNEKVSSFATSADKIRETFLDYPRFLGRKSLSLGLLTRRNLGIKHNNFISSNTIEDTTTTTTTSICLSLPFVNLALLKFGDSKTNISSGAKAGSFSVRSIIPIVGGLLSCQCGSNSSNYNTATNNLGHLQFDYFLTNKGNGVNAVIIETRIVKYKPKLAGCLLPLNKSRQMLYLGIQRPIHAYVMWRFHRHCHSLLIT